MLIFSGADREYDLKMSLPKIDVWNSNLIVTIKRWTLSLSLSLLVEMSGEKAYEMKNFFVYIDHNIQITDGT